MNYQQEKEIGAAWENACREMGEPVNPVAFRLGYLIGRGSTLATLEENAEPKFKNICGTDQAPEGERRTTYLGSMFERKRLPCTNTYVPAWWGTDKHIDLHIDLHRAAFQGIPLNTSAVDVIGDLDAAANFIEIRIKPFNKNRAILYGSVQNKEHTERREGVCDIFVLVDHLEEVSIAEVLQAYAMRNADAYVNTRYVTLYPAEHYAELL